MRQRNKRYTSAATHANHASLGPRPQDVFIFSAAHLNGATPADFRIGNEWQSFARRVAKSESRFWHD